MPFKKGNRLSADPHRPVSPDHTDKIPNQESNYTENYKHDNLNQWPRIEKRIRHILQKLQISTVGNKRHILEDIADKDIFGEKLEGGGKEQELKRYQRNDPPHKPGEINLP